MSLLRPSVAARESGEALVHELKQATEVLMNEDDSEQQKAQIAGLTPHQHARAIVRLVQCPQCSRPYRTPITLPCGNSLCRSCLPDSHRRTVTYPDLPGRRRGINCPFRSCGQEHATGECSVDVTLTKVIESIQVVVAKENEILGSQPMEVDTTSAGPSLEKSTVIITAPGHLVATYNLAAAGGLAYDAEVLYETDIGEVEDGKAMDHKVLAQLLESTHKEVDCQVCYNLMYDPVTTGCGHTLCRNCLVRTLDHSLNCPVCRRIVLGPISLQLQPSNKTLVNLLKGLCPELVAARAEAVVAEDSIGLGEFDTPLFICTLGFPGCPTFLRVFEPRYRLMIRRALEGNRTFGIIMYNSRGIPQGDLGNVQFMEYGTLLKIVNVQFLRDGTSVIETKGVSRFRVKRTGQLDGYTVSSVERVEDVPLAEEERLELEDTAGPPAAEGDIEGQLGRMTTRQLLMLGLDFIMRMQDRSAPWLQERILSAYGGPPQDAALFPFWLASILPISEEEKYRLLQTNTVRERLKITATWTRHMESQRWYQANACTVL